MCHLACSLSLFLYLLRLLTPRGVFLPPEDDDDDDDECLPSFTMILVKLLLLLHAMCSTRACEKYRDVIEGYVINIFRVHYTCCCCYLSIFLSPLLSLSLCLLPSR